MKNPGTPPIPEPNAERARRRFEECIRELQAAPAVRADYVLDVALADTETTLVAHSLARQPVMVKVSPPRGPLTSGRIEELRPEGMDRTRYVALKASGYGITVLVDVEIL